MDVDAPEHVAHRYESVSNSLKPLILRVFLTALLLSALPVCLSYYKTVFGGIVQVRENTTTVVSSHLRVDQPGDRTADDAPKAHAPTFAVCIVGQVRTLVRKDIQDHIYDAVLAPLLIGGKVHVFLHLDKKGVNVDVKTELRSWFSLESLRVYDVEPHGRVGEVGCVSAGYPQVYRQRECLRDVQAYGNRSDVEFDHFILTRTDIEYYARLPPGETWYGLKRNLVLNGMVIYRDEVDGNSVGSGREVSFMTDAFTIIPREALDSFATMANAYENCISTHPPSENTCGDRWSWSECRIQMASASYQVGKLSTAAGEVYRGTIFRCEDSACLSIRRDYCQTEPCDVARRSLASSLVGSQIEFTDEYRSV